MTVIFPTLIRATSVGRSSRRKLKFSWALPEELKLGLATVAFPITKYLTRLFIQRLTSTVALPPEYFAGRPNSIWVSPFFLPIVSVVDLVDTSAEADGLVVGAGFEPGELEAVLLVEGLTVAELVATGTTTTEVGVPAAGLGLEATGCGVEGAGAGRSQIG
jgi:hypothetical protein